MWPEKFYLWNMTCEMRHEKCKCRCEMGQVKYYVWIMTCEKWNVTCEM